MYSLIVQNIGGERLDITGSFEYDAVKIDGLTPAAAEISLQDASGYDGGIFSQSRTGSRNIIIEIIPNGDIEAARQKLYTFFIPKRQIRVYFENENRSVYIDGYTESVEGDIFTEIQKIQISIICPQPYFTDNSDPEHVLSPGQILSVFEFPFEIDTSSEGIEFSSTGGDGVSVSIAGGEIESGIIFYIDLYKYTTTPANIIVSNDTTGDEIEIENDGIWGNHKGLIYINTYDGEKQAYFRNEEGVITNIIPYISIKNKWIKLEPGINLLRVRSKQTSGQEFNAYCHTNRYYVGV